MLSVVLPVFNCASLMGRHLEAMDKWADLADEIIVVDSRSTDGTLDLIRARLRHPNLRIIERDRGLYQSWNEGIAATSGDWIYISTSGDTIERAHLLHLLEIGGHASADVVISPPRFVDEDGATIDDLGWPPCEIVSRSGLEGPFVLTSEAAFVLAYLYCPSAILGSSASNLYRGEHLRARPFPTDFMGAGDSIWILKHADDSRLCFTPTVGSTFCVHEKADPMSQQKLSVLLPRIQAEKTKSLACVSAKGKLAQRLAAEGRQQAKVQRAHQERRRLWHLQPRNASALCAWLLLTLDYLRYRLKLAWMRRRIRAIFRSDSTYLAVSVPRRKST